MRTPSIKATPKADRHLPSARLIAWIALCLWCAYWTWHVVWWAAGASFHGAGTILLALVVGSMPALLLGAMLVERLRGLPLLTLAWPTMRWHCLASFLLGALLVSSMAGVLAFLGFVFLFMALIDLPALFLVWLFCYGRPDASGALYTSLLAGATVGIAALLCLWSLAAPLIVGGQAKHLAGSDPYCLQVNQDMNYLAVNRWEDLRGFRLTAPWRSAGQSISSGETRWVYHAVLVVERDGKPVAYNWSHWAQDFRPLPETHQRIASYELRREVTIFCDPVPDYLEKLGQHQPAKPPLLRLPPWRHDSGFLRPLSVPQFPSSSPAPPEPIVPAASWQERYWSYYLARFQSMEALIAVCGLEVDTATRQRISEGIAEAGQGLGLAANQVQQSAQDLLVRTKARAPIYCEPSHAYHRGLVSSFPSVDRAPPR